jgi:DNA invertase Pin-like site-specific DNA recombinase
VGRLLFNVLSMVAEFEADLIRMRTRKGAQRGGRHGLLRAVLPRRAHTTVTRGG